MKIILNCGDAKDELHDLNLSEFIGTDADSMAQTKAFAVLQDLMNDPEFADDGRRNDDAVNFCIALHVLGYNPVDWFEELDDIVQFARLDYYAMADHIARVAEYLDSWGPEGNKAKALDKLITK